MCFKERKTPAIIVAVLSLIICILAVVVIALAFNMSTGKFATATEDISGFQVVIAYYFYFCVGLAVVAFITACLGCASAKIENRCPIFFFGIISFILMILYLIIGGTLVLIVGATDAELQAVCDASANNDRQSDTMMMIQDIDALYYDVGQTMCSVACPCPIEFSGTWSEAEIGLTESEINKKYGRTYLASSDNSTIGTDLFYLYFTDDPDIRTFTSFYDCLTRDDIDTDFSGQEYLETVSQFVSYFEENDSCTGICESSLFFFVSELSKGIPERTCIKPIQRLVKDTMFGLGICVFLTGVFFVCAFCCQYCLWKKRD